MFLYWIKYNLCILPIHDKLLKCRIYPMYLLLIFIVEGVHKNLPGQTSQQVGNFQTICILNSVNSGGQTLFPTTLPAMSNALPALLLFTRHALCLYCTHGTSSNYVQRTGGGGAFLGCQTERYSRLAAARYSTSVSNQTYGTLQRCFENN
jgi:hypothetical protein